MLEQLDLNLKEVRKREKEADVKKAVEEAVQDLACDKKWQGITSIGDIVDKEFEKFSKGARTYDSNETAEFNFYQNLSNTIRQIKNKVKKIGPKSEVKSYTKRMNCILTNLDEIISEISETIEDVDDIKEISPDIRESVMESKGTIMDFDQEAIDQTINFYKKNIEDINVCDDIDPELD